MCHSGSSSVALLRRNRLRHSSGRLIDKICLAGRTSKQKIGLLELSGKQLQCHQISSFNWLVHTMNGGLGSVVFTPNCCCHRSCFTIDCDRGHGIPPSSLDRSDVKAEYVASTMCTTDMEIDVAVKA